jgi:NAD dependent epimerase/dehydratase family enzyme
MGEELLLSSQKVEAGKLISTGYPFRYRELKASLQALLGR